MRFRYVGPADHFLDDIGQSDVETDDPELIARLQNSRGLYEEVPPEKPAKADPAPAPALEQVD